MGISSRCGVDSRPMEASIVTSGTFACQCLISKSSCIFEVNVIHRMSAVGSLADGLCLLCAPVGWCCSFGTGPSRFRDDSSQFWAQTLVWTVVHLWHSVCFATKPVGFAAALQPCAFPRRVSRADSKSGVWRKRMPVRSAYCASAQCRHVRLSDCTPVRR